ncbi:MAG: beta-propeller fold lactonase family protein, partial [Bacteroidota bacterium]
PTENTTFDCTDIGTSIIFLDRTDSDFPAVSLSITVESSDFSLPAITTDFCTDRTFDLTSLEEDITTASGTFSYTQQIERLYVPNWDAGTINVIDLNTNNILTTITVGEEPYGVQVSPDHLKVYVANYRDNTVSVIDVVSNTVEATITGGFNRPWSIAFNSDGSRAYVSNREGDNVIVINTSTNSIIESAITVGDAPEAVIVSPDDAKVYVANYDTDNVTVINTSDNSTSTISIENNPRDLALSADGSQLYVCNRSGSISVIDIATDMVEQHVATETQTPEAFTVIPTGNIYTVHGNRENGAINVLESGSPFQVSKTLIDPDNINFFEGICANDDGSIIFLVDRLKDLIHLFNTNTNTEISTIQLAGLSLIVGDFYAKTTITLTDPTAFSPLLGDVINVAFDGGEECAATTTITFDEGYTQIAQLEITAIITSDSLFNSADTILTTGTVEIEANDTIIFEAADLILLQQGFHAKANSAFQARILPSACGDATQNIQSEVESRSQEVATNETTAQIVQDNDMQLIASPNPLRAFTQLEFYIPKEGAIHIYLSNMQGQMVYEQHFSNLAVGWQQTQISVPHLPDGMYFLQLRSTEQQVVKQLVIQQ